ncbi:hypothetical protein BC831DRAFT_11902 [Entophlyctis helioformis]|nr:hypothetical protein BC831DRAFT_11902 [Entophlyctis helioformis]
MSVEYRPQFDMAMEWASAATALLAYTGLVTSLTYQIRSLLAGSRSTVVLAITAGTSVTILNTTVEVVNTYLNKSTAVQVFFMWTQFFTVLFSNLVGLEVLYVFAPLVPGLSARAVRYMQAGAAVFQVIAWGGGYVRVSLGFHCVFGGAAGVHVCRYTLEQGRACSSVGDETRHCATFPAFRPITNALCNTVLVYSV